MTLWHLSLRWTSWTDILIDFLFAFGAGVSLGWIRLPKDIPRFLMNKSKAWIIERFVPEGTKEYARGRNMSRYRQFRNKMFGKLLEDGTRPAHWRIIRPNGDEWEDVRHRDRMVLETAMQEIKKLLVSKGFTLRLRNIKTNDIIMGDILKADLPRPDPEAIHQSSTKTWGGGGVTQLN